MGPTVVPDTGKVKIVVVSNQHEPNDCACFMSLDIDPQAKRYQLLKSGVHWRPGFTAITKAVVECAGTGVWTSNFGTLDFRPVRRPLNPLDPRSLALALRPLRHGVWPVGPGVEPVADKAGVPRQRIAEAFAQAFAHLGQGGPLSPLRQQHPARPV
jgi:hypothetical protein